MTFKQCTTPHVFNVVITDRAFKRHDAQVLSMAYQISWKSGQLGLTLNGPLEAKTQILRWSTSWAELSITLWRHADGWRYISTHSQFRHHMQVKGSGITAGAHRTGELRVCLASLKIWTHHLNVHKSVVKWSEVKWREVQRREGVKVVCNGKDIYGW